MKALFAACTALVMVSAASADMAVEITRNPDPQPGLAYRQEHLAGEAEDRAEVVSLTEEVSIPLGTFT